MPFLAPLAASAIGTFLINAAVNAAITYGISYAAEKLFGEDEQQQAPSGTIVQTQYGEKVALNVAVGRVVSPPLREVRKNSFGPSRKYLQIVYEISHWYTSSFNGIALNGEWVTLGADTARGMPVTSGKFANKIWVKYYDGHQTTAHQELVDNANPSTNWTSNHIGYGISYIVVTLEHDSEVLNSVPAMILDYNGAPLYDIRKDGSVGGVGAHRWNDVTTWEFSENPALIDYNFRRGAFQYGGKVFVGMDLLDFQLPFDDFVAAANVCDESVDGEARYRSSMHLNSQTQFGSALENIGITCAAIGCVNRNTYYPVINSVRTPVATLGYADLVDSAPFSETLYGSFSDAVYKVSGTHNSPDHLGKPISYKEIDASALITSTGRARDVVINMDAVPSKRQAEQLASIYASEAAFSASKDVVVDEKWQSLDKADWIIWKDDIGGVDRIYQIMAISSVTNSGQGVKLSLRERSAQIYANIGIVAPSPPLPISVAPIYTNEIPNAAFTPILIPSDGTATVPGFRVSWDFIEDTTVEDILIQWRKVGSAHIFHTVVPRGQTIAVIQEGILSDTNYEIRSQIISVGRTSPSETSWAPVTSLVATAQDVTLAQLQDDIREPIINNNKRLNELEQHFNQSLSAVQVDLLSSEYKRQTIHNRLNQSFSNIIKESSARVTANEAIATDLTTVTAGVNENTAQIAQEASARATADTALASDITTVTAGVGNNTALITQEATARVDADSAQATQITGLAASVNDSSASGLIKFEAITNPLTADIEIALFARASVGENFAQSGLILKANADANGGAGGAYLIGDQVAIADGAGNITALFNAQGQIVNGRLAADSVLAGNIVTGTITAEQIAISGLTDNSSVYASDSNAILSSSNSWVDIPSFTITKTIAANTKTMVHLGAYLTSSSGYQAQIRVLVNGVWRPSTDHRMTASQQGGSGGSSPSTTMILDLPQGTHVFKAQWQSPFGTNRSYIRAREMFVMQFLR